MPSTFDTVTLLSLTVVRLIVACAPMPIPPAMATGNSSVGSSVDSSALLPLMTLSSITSVPGASIPAALAVSPHGVAPIVCCAMPAGS